MTRIIPGLLDTKYKKGEIAKQGSKYFTPSNLQLVKFNKSNVASSITQRYFKGIAADCDNLVIVVTDDERNK